MNSLFYHYVAALQHYALVLGIVPAEVLLQLIRFLQVGYIAAFSEKLCIKSLTEREDSVIAEKKSLSVEEFKIKVEKLKIMKEAGLLSDEKFEEEQANLLLLL